MYTIRACIFLKTFSASLGTGLFLDKVVPDLTMSTFQTHTGSAFRVAQRRISHINQKKGGGARGEKRPSSGKSGPSRNHEQIGMEYGFLSYHHWQRGREVLLTPFYICLPLHVG